MDLNTILIIVGIVALLALIVHGLWSNRREKSKYFGKANKFDRPTQQDISRAQVERGELHAPIPHHEPSHRDSSNNAPITHQVMPNQVAQTTVDTVDYRQSEKSVDDIKISIPNVQPVYDMGHSRTEPAVKPVQAQYDMPAPANLAEMTLEQLEQQSQQNDFEGINSSSPELRKQLSELVSDERQSEYTVSFNEPKPVAEKPKQTSGYIQLYLIPEYTDEFNGAKLVQALENLGFLFGDQDMYHRHLDLSVASPVLFSVANLQQPGTFDPYNLADFSTVGIVLFMHLPSPGNNLANLRMMIRAARTLAEDLQGVVLTEEQDIFDEKAEQDYLSRVA